MNPNISQKQKDDIRNEIVSGNFNLEIEIKKLTDQGHSKESAAQCISDELKKIKTEIFNRKLEEKNKEEHQKIAVIATIMIACIGPIFDTLSLIWYTIAFILAGIAGFFGAKDKPAAGILSALLLILSFPFAYNFYFSDRSSFIKIELLIPMFMAVIPCYILYFIIDKLFYSEKQ